VLEVRCAFTLLTKVEVMALYTFVPYTNHGERAAVVAHHALVDFSQLLQLRLQAGGVLQAALLLRLTLQCFCYFLTYQLLKVYMLVYS
jgi:hypothetical protein